MLKAEKYYIEAIEKEDNRFAFANLILLYGPNGRLKNTEKLDNLLKKLEKKNIDLNMELSYLLGYRCEHAYGREKNLEHAKFHYETVVNLGFEEVRADLERVKEQLKAQLPTPSIQLRY
jgi:TPR repeat protein